MPQYQVATPQQNYLAVIERGVIARLSEFIPAGRGKVFVVTTRDVWDFHGGAVQRALGDCHADILFFAGGEENKRISHVEDLAGQMMELGADRSSIVIAFGGGSRCAAEPRQH